MRKNCAKKVQKTSEQRQRELERERERKEREREREHELIDDVFGRGAASQLDSLRRFRSDLLSKKRGRKVDFPKKEDELAAGRSIIIEEINFIEKVVTRTARLHNLLEDLFGVVEDTEEYILKGK